MKREIWRNYPVMEKVELVERLLDRGVLDDGRRVSKQPGRCCATGCEVPSLPRGRRIGRGSAHSKSQKQRRRPMDADAQSRYPQAYAAWKADPSAFWAEAARAIDWFKPAEKVFDPHAGVYGRWFVGAECNTCHNAVDRHVRPGGASRRRSSTTAPLAGREAQLTYAELQDEVARSGRRPAGFRRRERRPGHPLHADDPRGRGRHAGLRPHWRDTLGRVRRLRRQGTGDAHRRRQPEARFSPPPAASSRTASSPTSRCSTRRSSSRVTSRSAASFCNGRRPTPR